MKEDVVRSFDRSDRDWSWSPSTKPEPVRNLKVEIVQLLRSRGGEDRAMSFRDIQRKLRCRAAERDAAVRALVRADMVRIERRVDKQRNILFAVETEAAWDPERLQAAVTRLVTCPKCKRGGACMTKTGSVVDYFHRARRELAAAVVLLVQRVSP